MADTEYADHSYYQHPLDRRHLPFKWDSCRSNDGDFCDPQFEHNIAEMGLAIAEGRLVGGEVYYVYRPGGNGVRTHVRLMTAALAKIRKLHGAQVALKIFSVIDIESWGGAIQGDHSAAIRAERETVIRTVQAKRRRAVKLYANQGDRASICPRWGDAKWIIANYSHNPRLKDQLVHQFADDLPAGSLGSKVDRNSADGYTPAAFLKANGYVAPTTVKQVTWASAAAAAGLSVAALLALNPGHKANDVIKPGTHIVTKAPVKPTKKPTPVKTTPHPTPTPSSTTLHYGGVTITVTKG